MSEVFASGPYPHLNACVGENTAGDNSYGYMTGFAQATEVLLEAAKKQYYEVAGTDEMRGVYMDALIYPICFCMRHHIELFLKRQLLKVSRLRNPSIDVPAIHELGDLLDALKEACETEDRRLSPKLAALESTITAFDRMDPNGQTFRYSTSNDGTPHLADVSHINLAVLGEAVTHFNAAADDFDHYVEAIAQEYWQGTFTKKLSRVDLYELAEALPAQDTWGEPTGRFLEVKKEFSQKFELSGKEFSTAVDAIKAHRYFGSLIGVSLPLPHVDASDIDLFATGLPSAELAGRLPREKWSAWHAIYEVGAQGMYSEYFDFLLARLLDEESETRSYPSDVLRFARQSPLKVLHGLKRLGQKDLVQHFEQVMAQAIQDEEKRRASPHPLSD
ncbi:hypothetical protein SCB29_22395 [Paraburkholderia sp. SIMBA_055]